MKVLTFPHPDYLTKLTDGISQVVHHYAKYLPEFGIELVDQNATTFDLVAGHVGQGMDKDGPYVAHIHGMHWTADQPYGPTHYVTNARIVDACRRANAVTVPSEWVAETFQRDMRIAPHIIPHGIDWDDWQHKEPASDYVLWNKNRSIGVCDPSPVVALARLFPKGHFVTTFLPYKTQKPPNTNVTGLIPHPQMKRLVQSAAVYLSTTKETFGIGTLEALASGTPVLGYAWGGNLELVQHGVNGYLAKPDDLDDLERGLRYCLTHRRVLSANARESAKQWSWRAAVEKVVEVYRMSAQVEPPTVAVVIPVYNKPEAELRRAIESVINQTLSVQRIIVVDDGSRDGSAIENVVLDYSRNGHPITYTRQHNSGVAIARNNGIADSDTKYVCPLDPDDWLDPDFIRRCVNELEKDPTLAIAYTGLTWHKPGGTEGLSDWPGDWDFDAQVRLPPGRQNQIPTCCVFRRKMWERLGGYRQRYAPEGCGQEDAEFWLRAGAYGFKARKITKKGLFHYSWLSGQVSGNRQHQEVDWTGWHPWTSDKKHPFASYATPAHISHPVRQYDEPTVSVVIPVGPGHTSKLIDALDSLEAQTFRRWEAIIVWDHTPQPDEYQRLKAAYPYIREAHSNGRGAGYARNRGAELARGAFLVFLDADDYLAPEFLERTLSTWNEYRGIIYTDYVGRAMIGNPDDLAPDLRNRIYNYNPRTQETIIGYRSLDYEPERAQSQPPQNNRERPYIWCNVTSLIPTAWHVEIGGFNESLTSWEDVDYHWRLAKRGHCYYRVPVELMVYNFHTGNRRENGRQIHAELLDYLREKHKELEIMPCSGCGGRTRSPATLRTNSTFARDAQVERIADNDFIEVRYVAGKGLHQVTGAATFEQRLPGWSMIRRGPESFSISYGRRQGGDKFLVHQRDVELMPGRFMPIEAEVAVAPAPRVKQITRPPEPLPEIPPEELEPVVLGADEAESVVDGILTPPFDLQTLPGISGPVAEAMKAAGIKDADDVKRLGVEGLTQIKGIGEKRAEMILMAVQGQ